MVSTPLGGKPHIPDSILIVPVSTIPSSSKALLYSNSNHLGSNHFASDLICPHSVAVRIVVGIAMAQQWLWLAVSDKAESSNIITLYQGGRMEWNNKMNTGHWTYEYDVAIGQGVFYIEFSAKNSPRKRQHILRQIDDWPAVLLPADHHNYIDNTHFSTKSAIHRNTKKIVTQMKLGPLLSSPPKRRRTSGIYQPKANDDQPYASDDGIHRARL